MGFFGATRPGREARHGTASFELPILYFRDDCFALFFTADVSKVRAAMPSERLHPVCVFPGRALVGVAAFNYIDTSIGPYGEVAVIAAAVFGKRPPPPVVPALLQARYPAFGAVVLHLPVTTQLARDAGRGQWGYTKFVADMHFQHTPEFLECRLAEAEQHILTLRVPRAGLTLRERAPLITYSVLDGSLIKTVIPQRGIRRESGLVSNGWLALGSHPVAESVGALDLSGRPMLSRYYLERSAILPAGEVIERGVRPLDGYRGTDRVGEHVVQCPPDGDGAASS